MLTLSETTDFRLFQIQGVCSWQFQIWWKWQKVLQKGRKHSGKRRNYSLRAISPFPMVFSKDLPCRRVKTRACLGKGWKYFLHKNQILSLITCMCYHPVFFRFCYKDTQPSGRFWDDRCYNCVWGNHDHFSFWFRYRLWIFKWYDQHHMTKFVDI